MLLRCCFCIRHGRRWAVAAVERQHAVPRQTRPGELGDPWPLPTPAFLRQEYGAAVQQCVESCQRGSMPAMMFAAINQIPVRRSAWRGRRHRRRVFEAPQTLVIPLALKAEGHDAGAQPTSKIQTSRLGRNQLGRYGATGVTETRRRPPSRHLHLQHQALSAARLSSIRPVLGPHAAGGLGWRRNQTTRVKRLQARLTASATELTAFWLLRH